MLGPLWRDENRNPSLTILPEPLMPAAPAPLVSGKDSADDTAASLCLGVGRSLPLSSSKALAKSLDVVCEGRRNALGKRPLVSRKGAAADSLTQASQQQQQSIRGQRGLHGASRESNQRQLGIDGSADDGAGSECPISGTEGLKSFLRSTETAVHAWKAPQWDASMSDDSDMLRYSLWDQFIEAAESASRCSLGLTSCSPSASTDTANGTALDPHEAACELADANLSVDILKEMLSRVCTLDGSESTLTDVGKPKPLVTRELVKTADMYGNMVDHMKALSSNAHYFSRNVLGNNRVYTVEGIGDPGDLSEREFDIFETQIRAILKELSELNNQDLMDQAVSFLKAVENNDLTLKDMLDRQMKERGDTLGLLSQSKYATEEALNTHLYHSAATLCQFYELVVGYAEKGKTMKPHQVASALRALNQLRADRDRFLHLASANLKLGGRPSESPKAQTLRMVNTGLGMNALHRLMRQATENARGSAIIDIHAAEAESDGPTPMRALLGSPVAEGGGKRSDDSPGSGSATSRSLATPLQLSLQLSLRASAGSGGGAEKEGPAASPGAARKGSRKPMLARLPVGGRHRLSLQSVDHIKKIMLRASTQGRDFCEEITQMKDIARVVRFDLIRRLRLASMHLSQRRFADKLRSLGVISQAFGTEGEDDVIARLPETCPDMKDALQGEVRYNLRHRREMWDELNELTCPVNIQFLMKEDNMATPQAIKNKSMRLERAISCSPAPGDDDEEGGDQGDDDPVVQLLIDNISTLENSMAAANLEYDTARDHIRRITRECNERLGIKAWLYDDRMRMAWIDVNPRWKLLPVVHAQVEFLREQGALMLGRGDARLVQNCKYEADTLGWLFDEEERERASCRLTRVEFDAEKWHNQANRRFDRLVASLAIPHRNLQRRIGVSKREFSDWSQKTVDGNTGCTTSADMACTLQRQMLAKMTDRINLHNELERAESTVEQLQEKSLALARGSEVLAAELERESNMVAAVQAMHDARHRAYAARNELKEMKFRVQMMQSSGIDVAPNLEAQSPRSKSMAAPSTLPEAVRSSRPSTIAKGFKMATHSRSMVVRHTGMGHLAHASGGGRGFGMGRSGGFGHLSALEGGGGDFADPAALRGGGGGGGGMSFGRSGGRGGFDDGDDLDMFFPNETSRSGKKTLKKIDAFRKTINNYAAMRNNSKEAATGESTSMQRRGFRELRRQMALLSQSAAQARKLNTVLLGRLETKRSILRDTIAACKLAIGVDLTNLMETQQMLQEKWADQIGKWQRIAVTDQRMLNYWTDKFAEWHEDLQDKYGETIVQLVESCAAADDDDEREALEQVVIKELKELAVQREMEEREDEQELEMASRHMFRRVATKDFGNLNLDLRQVSTGSDSFTLGSPRSGRLVRAVSSGSAPEREEFEGIGGVGMGGVARSQVQRAGITSAQEDLFAYDPVLTDGAASFGVRQLQGRGTTFTRRKSKVFKGSVLPRTSDKDDLDASDLQGVAEEDAQLAEGVAGGPPPPARKTMVLDFFNKRQRPKVGLKKVGDKKMHAFALGKSSLTGTERGGSLVRSDSSVATANHAFDMTLMSGIAAASELLARRKNRGVMNSESDRDEFSSSSASGSSSASHSASSSADFSSASEIDLNNPASAKRDSRRRRSSQGRKARDLRKKMEQSQLPASAFRKQTIHAGTHLDMIKKRKEDLRKKKLNVGQEEPGPNRRRMLDFLNEELDAHERNNGNAEDDVGEEQMAQRKILKRRKSTAFVMPTLSHKNKKGVAHMDSTGTYDELGIVTATSTGSTIRSMPSAKSPKGVVTWDPSFDTMNVSPTRKGRTPKILRSQSAQSGNTKSTRRRLASLSSSGSGREDEDEEQHQAKSLAERKAKGALARGAGGRSYSHHFGGDLLAESDSDEEGEEEEGPPEMSTDAVQRVLRYLRKLLLAEFGSLPRAYAWAAESQDDFGISGLTLAGFVSFTGTFGIQPNLATGVFQHIVKGTVPARGAAHGLSCREFERVVGRALPIPSLGALRARLVKRYGRLSIAFLGAALVTHPQHRGLLTMTAFRWLGASVAATKEEATRFFRKIAKHNESSFDGKVGQEKAITRRAFMLTLHHAEGLSAARRLRAQLRSAPGAAEAEAAAWAAQHAAYNLSPMLARNVCTTEGVVALAQKALQFWAAYAHAAATARGGVLPKYVLGGGRKHVRPRSGAGVAALVGGDVDAKEAHLTTARKEVAIRRLLNATGGPLAASQPRSAEELREALQAFAVSPQDSDALFRLVAFSGSLLRGTVSMERVALATVAGIGVESQRLASIVFAPRWRLHSTIGLGQARRRRWRVRLGPVLGCWRCGRQYNFASHICCNCAAKIPEDHNRNHGPVSIKQHLFQFPGGRPQQVGNAAVHAQERRDLRDTGKMETRRFLDLRYSKRSPFFRNPWAHEDEDSVAKPWSVRMGNGELTQQPWRSKRRPQAHSEPYHLDIAPRRSGFQSFDKPDVERKAQSLRVVESAVRTKTSKVEEQSGQGKVQIYGNTKKKSGQKKSTRLAMRFGDAEEVVEYQVQEEDPEDLRQQEDEELAARQAVRQAAKKARSAREREQRLKADLLELELHSPQEQSPVAKDPEGRDRSRLYGRKSVIGKLVTSPTSGTSRSSQAAHVAAQAQEPQAEPEEEPALDFGLPPEGENVLGEEVPAAAAAAEEASGFVESRRSSGATQRSNNSRGRRAVVNEGDVFALKDKASDESSKSSDDMRVVRAKKSIETPVNKVQNSGFKAKAQGVAKLKHAVGILGDGGPMRRQGTGTSSASMSPRRTAEKKNSVLEAKLPPLPCAEMDEERMQQRALSATACHQRRLALFGGNRVELMIATQKLQEFRLRCIKNFKSFAKAFAKLAGSMDAAFRQEDLREKAVKFLSFNPLDAQRVESLVGTIVDEEKIGYAEFLEVLRFAAPVSTTSELRSRLVQRHCLLKIAFKVLGLRGDQELDIGTFEQLMLGAGVVAKDSHRIFKAMDATQPGGSQGVISFPVMSAALENAHVISWLEAFHSQVSSKSRNVFSALVLVAASQGRSTVAIAGTSQFRSTMAQFEFPISFAPDTFDFLTSQRRHRITIDSFAQTLCDAFGRSGEGGGDDHRASAAGNALGSHEAPVLAAGATGGPARKAFGSYLTPTTHGSVLVLGGGNGKASFAMSDVPKGSFSRGSPLGGSTPRGSTRRPSPPYSARRSSKDGGGTQPGTQKKAEVESPGRRLMTLRANLMEKFQSKEKAWAALSGKESAEDLGLVQWQQEMQKQFQMEPAESQRLFAVLRASSCCAQPVTEREPFRQPIRKRAFMATLQGYDGVAVMLDLLHRAGTGTHTPFRSVSAVFEGGRFSPGPLAEQAFIAEMHSLLALPHGDATAVFKLLDFSKDGSLEVNDVLDAIVAMQAAYLPSAPPTTLMEIEEEQVRPARFANKAKMVLSLVKLTESGGITGSRPAAVVPAGAAGGAGALPSITAAAVGASPSSTKEDISSLAVSGASGGGADDSPAPSHSSKGKSATAATADTLKEASPRKEKDNATAAAAELQVGICGRPPASNSRLSDDIPGFGSSTTMPGSELSDFSPSASPEGIRRPWTSMGLASSGGPRLRASITPDVIPSQARAAGGAMRLGHFAEDPAEDLDIGVGRPFGRSGPRASGLGGSRASAFLKMAPSMATAAAVQGRPSTSLGLAPSATSARSPGLPQLDGLGEDAGAIPEGRAKRMSTAAGFIGGPRRAQSRTSQAPLLPATDLNFSLGGHGMSPSR